MNVVDAVQNTKPRNQRVNFSLRLSRGTFSNVISDDAGVRVIVMVDNTRYELFVP